jgi:alanine-synthesizing transaminase
LAFSRRLPWAAPENALAARLRERRRTACPILDLTESNPARAGLAHDPGILAALSDPRAVSYDPAALGLLEARQAICAYYADRGVSVEPENVMLTASTSEAYSFLFKALCDPGDEVLAPRPCYPLLEHLAGLEGVKITHYSLAYQEGWWVDFESFRRTLTPRTRALVFVNPNNPTGNFLRRSELEELGRFSGERELPVICDEVFSDCAFGANPFRLETLAGGPLRSVSLHGLSKLLGLPQMKLGWMVLNGPDPWRAELRRRLEWIGDTYLSVNTPVQYAASRWIEGWRQFQLRLRRQLMSNLATLDTMLRGHPACSRLHLEGGWYAIVRVPRTRSDEEWAILLLDEESVLVQPGYFYDFESEGYLVISLLVSPAVFREGVERMLKRIRA